MRKIVDGGPRSRAIVWALFAVVGLGAAFLFLTTERHDPAVEAPLSVAAALSSDTSGYARAVEPRPFRFPEDHGPHPEFRTEWWYYTGNLAGPGGRRFAYQFTLFRTALSPPDKSSPQPDTPSIPGGATSSVRAVDSLAAEAGGTASAHGTPSAPAGDLPSATAGNASLVTAGNASSVPSGDPPSVKSGDTPANSAPKTWSTRQLYMGHLAVTDVASGEHVAFERFSRGAAGLAGAQADPFRVWLENWDVSGLSGADSVRIHAADGDVALSLVLASRKPIVLRGDRGLDQKGPESGNASYYFSMTRLATTGHIRVGGTTYDVAGWSWMDREWSTSALSKDQVGWDWFSLQLGDNVEVMYYRLRRSDGSTSPFSTGSITQPDGGGRTLEADEVQLTTRDTWASRSTGIRYPSSWTLEIPTEPTRLQIEPLIADQELDLSVRYWEGAVRVHGTFRGRSIEGFGFVELTGYGEESTP